MVDYSLPLRRKNIPRKKCHVYFVLSGYVKCVLKATVGLQANDSINDGVTYGPQGAVAYLTASKLLFLAPIFITRFLLSSYFGNKCYLNKEAQVPFQCSCEPCYNK